MEKYAILNIELERSACMKHFCVALLALLLCVGLMLPAFAVPQSAMIDTAVVAAEKAVGTDTPGAAVVVFEGGRRVLFEGYGYADITARTLVTAETSFELGTLSSLFVALGAQALVEDGKLELDKAGLVAFAHGEYFALGEKLGNFGYSVRKKKKAHNTPKAKKH